MKELAEKLANLTVLEVCKLAEIMKVEYGIEPADADVITVTNTEVEEIEVKTEFNVMLTSFGDKKLDVVKAVKDLTGKGLKESMDLVNSIPALVGDKISEVAAQILKEKLEHVGATVEIK